MWFFYDRYYLLLIIPAMLIAVAAQGMVSMTFAKYNKKFASGGQTAFMAARKILDQAGLHHVRIEHVSGRLTDHFDPRTNVIRLSDSVYGSASIGAIGVAAHEAGHAVQYATGYFPIKLRNAIIPVTRIGSQLSIPLVLLGFIMQMEPLITIGIILFATLTVFQLVTLPVEFNASRRAIDVLSETGILYGDEIKGAKKVLSAAAMTYVAALIMSVAQLLRLILLYGRRNR